MRIPNVTDSDYDRWMCVQGIRDTATSRLLHMLASREVRMEVHRIWRAERCNPIKVYNDDLDRMIALEVAEELEDRIDWARKAARDAD